MIGTYTLQGFHGYLEVSRKIAPTTSPQDTEFTYTFENFFHPFVGELIEKLNKESLPGLLDAKYHQNLAKSFFDQFYTLLTSKVVKINYFKKEIDLSEGGPYANYNWELLFHIPLTIAVHLSKNQRFAEAQRWFHYIFDPTCNDKDIPTPQRYWKFLAFRRSVDVTQIDQLLALLSKPDKECLPAELKLKAKILSGYEAIKNKPFQPHAVARTRHLAYQYCVVMKYLDNLIAWGDSLFRQDTVESINEATQLYVLAANILGPKPQRIPPRGAVRFKTFAQLKAQGLDPMGNALVELEGKFPFNLGLPQTQGSAPDATGPLFGIGRTLYFCIPRNDKLLGYWDTVADRLFKIRHCMNIEGVVRQLALFDPPIDPGMLVKAAAAGINIGSIVSGLNQPMGPARATLLIQKALELCAEVRSLGSALLSAIEKGDGEHLALLRQSHEIKIQQIAQEVRFLQWKQAQESTESLLRSRSSALERYHYYQRLFGLDRDINVAPDTFSLDRRELIEENFDETYAALVGNYDRAIKPLAQPQLGLAEANSILNIAELISKGNLYLTDNEFLALNVLPLVSAALRVGSASADVIFSVLSILPYAKVMVAPIGIGPAVELAVGQIFSNVGGAISRSIGTLATLTDSAASLVGQTASYERRADEWILQYNLAAHELMQIGRQIIGSLIAEQVAYHEYLNVKKQIEQSQEAERFLQEKFSNEELYLWMQGEISRLYYEYYRFAFDTARKAETAMKQELMRPELDATDYIKFNYWDGGRKGLLSGEALYLDLKRMEMVYHENNKREYELIKHISLLQVNPIALLQLRATGRCNVFLPEDLFDMDGPGHYFRRIKSVSVSIPCITGPYTSVNCTLTLLKSSIRKSPLLSDGGYAREGAEDDRFSDRFGSLQAIVTSASQNDSGLFEANLRDERYLPFEGSGVVSEWQLELPGDVRQFDYDTIADVIMHLRYTAREGGGLLRNGAIANLKDRIEEAQAVGSARLFSVRHEFPTEWHKFLYPGADQDQILVLNFSKERFPFFAAAGKIEITKIEFFAAGKDQSKYEVKLTLPGRSEELTLAQDQAAGSLHHNYLEGLTIEPQPDMPIEMRMKDETASDFRSLPPDEIRDFILVCHFMVS